MKCKNFRQLVSLVMALVMVLGILPMTAVAQDIYGTVYASSLSNGIGLDVYAKTKLVMDVDRTFAYINGNYTVNVEGSGSLTVEGDVNVRSLNVENTPLTVNGKITVSDELFVQSNYFYVLNGIEAEDLVRITSSHAFIAGDKNGIYCRYGNIELNGSEGNGGAIGINVGAKETALFAFNGSIALTGDILCNSNHKQTYCVVAEDDIYNGAGNYLNLTVTGSSGLISHAGNISLSAGTIDVQATGGFAMMADSGAVTLSCEKLAAISDGGLKGDASYPYGIGALEDIGVYVEGQAGIAGYEHGVYSVAGNISLDGGSYYIGSVTEDTVYAEAGSVYMNGDFRLLSEESYTIYAPEGAITIEGSLDSEGLMDSPRNHDDLLWNDIRFTMESKTGFDFYGTTLKIRGVGGISTGGDVSITADRVDTVTQMFTCVKGNNVYIDCDDLHLENQCVEFSAYISPGIQAQDGVTVYSDHAYICGDYGIYTSNYDHVVYTNLKGYFIVVGKQAGAISSDIVLVEGNLIAQNVNDDGYSTINAFAFEFDGEKLDVQGNGGIRIGDSGYIDINAKSTKIVTAIHAPIIATTGRVFIDSDYLYLVNQMKEDAWEYPADGILASYVELSSSDGTIVGSNGINSTGNVNLYGSFNITGLDQGISADILITETDRLKVSGQNAIYALNAVELRGNAEITSTGERNSGIWCENGYVYMQGNVVINTNGWYGINASTDVSFGKGYYKITGPEGNAQAVRLGENGDLYVHTDLQIVEPDGGHINGNNINGVGDSPAQNLLVYAAVGTVDIMVSTPSDGLYPIWDSSAIYALPPLSSFESITWFENGVKMDEDTPFTAGNEYSVEIILYADEGYYFASGVLATVNGKSSSMTGTLDGGAGLMIRADLGKCNTAIYSVDLDIAAPVDGNKPSTSVWTPDGAHYGVKSSNVRWMVSTDGINYTAMASGEKFVGGKYYQVYMDVTPSSSKYAFAVTTENGFLEPNVWAMVGGIITDVSKAYDQDPEQVITVCYTFGKCNDKYIENIDIVDVVRPVAGEHPSYTASVLGTGYHIDTTKNSYYDAYWVNEKWYYIKNGISWWDVTDGGYDYVYENDVFLPGHEYRCEIYLCTDDGYEFVMDLYAEPEIWPEATINGNTADVDMEGSNLMWNQEVSYTFACQAKTVSTIKINGIDTPKAGNTPDYTATVDGSGYVIDSIGWYNVEFEKLEANEVFGAEDPYRVQFCILPETVEGMDLVRFASDVQVYINGREVVQYGQWDEVVVSGNSVWVYYTFNKGSAAPEGGGSVSGSVTSFGGERALVTLQLLDGTTVAYETMVFGNSTDYYFSGVAAGTYTLRVMKNNHISREYTVVVEEDAQALDVKICLKGDTTGDGKVNMKDWSRLYDHISEVSELTDYNYLCADVTGDGKVNMKDWSRLYDHISEVNPLW